jgi:tetratricopeptide (TPR) repeat protein
MHGRLPELISWLEGALAATATANTRARAVGLRTLVEVLWFTQALDRIGEPLEQSLALCRQLGDKSGEANMLLILGGTFWAQGSIAKAIELQEAALGLWRAAGDRAGVERATNWLAGVYLDAGDAERSATLARDSIAMASEVGDQVSVAASLGGLGDAELVKDDPENAARHFRESLTIASDVGDERNEIYAIAGLACAAALLKDLHSAGRLWGIAEAAENRLGTAMVSGERARYELIMFPLQDDQTFQAGYQAGREMKLADAVRELRTTEKVN